MRNSMRTLWRVFHSSETLQKSNVVPTLRQQFAHDTRCICWRSRSSADGSERGDLIQSIEGYTIPHDQEAARRGIEWMREPTGAPWACGGIAFPLRLRSEPERFQERLPFRPRFVDLVGMHAVVLRRSQQESTMLRPQVIAVAID